MRAGARPVLVDVDDEGLLIDPAQVAQAVDDRDPGGDSRPPVRAGRPLRAAARRPGGTRHRGDRGRRPVPGRDPARQGGRHVRDDRGDELLPREEPGRLRRRRRGDDGRRRSWRSACACSARTAARRSTSTPRSGSTPGWTPCRRWCSGRSCVGCAAGTTSGGPRPPATASCSTASPACVCPRRSRATSTSGTSTSSGWPTATQVLERLNADGIGAGVHYPVPVHLTPAMAGLGYRPGAFPVSERAASEILSLPLFPGITPAQQDRVVDTLLSALRRP